MNRETPAPRRRAGPARSLLLWMGRATERAKAASADRKRMVNEDGIMLVLLVTVVGFAAAVIYHYIMGHYLGRPWPANSFLHTPEARFFDFQLVVRQSAGLDPFGEDIGGFAGSPLGQLAGYLFSLVRPAFLRLPLFLGFFLVAFTAMVRHYLGGLRSWPHYLYALAVFIIVFLSYPVLFAIDRGNLDMLVVPCLFLFGLTYERGKYRASTIFLGLAVALKPYAVILLAVYLIDRRLRYGLLAAFNAVFLSALCLSLFKDGLLVEGLKYVRAFTHTADYLSVGNQQAFTSDLYTLVTIIARAVGDLFHTYVYLPDYAAARIGYPLLAAVVAIYLIAHLWKEGPPLWKSLGVLTTLVVLLPIGGHDYRLTYLYVPMLMYLASSDRPRHALLIALLWGLLLVPKNYCALWSPPQNIGMVINPLLLVAMLITIMPGAFSPAGVTSTCRSLYARLRSMVPARHLANARSS